MTRLAVRHAARMLPRVEFLASRQCGVITRAQALAGGISDDELAGLVRSGAWRRQRYGVYEVSPAPDERTRLLRPLWGAVLVSGPGNVISGPSAAVVHGLDLVEVPSAVHLVSASPRSADGIRVTRRPRDVSCVEVDGLPVTDVVTTIIDCARVLRFAEAVVVADAALRARAFDKAMFLTPGASPRHSARAARVLRFADGRSESVGESLARVAMDAAGLPAPELQADLRGASGKGYRADYFWPEFRVIGEFDGKLKYADKDALWREKRREDDLRAAGHVFARFGTADVHRPVELARIVRAAFARRPPGTVAI